MEETEGSRLYFLVVPFKIEFHMDSENLFIGVPIGFDPESLNILQAKAKSVREQLSLTSSCRGCYSASLPQGALKPCFV